MVQLNSSSKYFSLTSIFLLSSWREAWVGGHHSCRIAHLWASRQTDTPVLLNLCLLGKKYWPHRCCVHVESNSPSGLSTDGSLSRPIGNLCLLSQPTGHVLLCRKIPICWVASVRGPEWVNWVLVMKDSLTLPVAFKYLSSAYRLQDQRSLVHLGQKYLLRVELSSDMVILLYRYTDSLKIKSLSHMMEKRQAV